MDGQMHIQARHPPLRAAVLTGLILSVVGCASTTVIEGRTDPAFHGPPIHKALIVGLQSDQTGRHVWEDAMVAALMRHGVAATPSYAVFSDLAPTATQLAGSATRDGFDGVIATHHVASRDRSYWMPGSAGIGFGWRWRSFDYWDVTYGPGYEEPESQSDYETDVFTASPNGEKLIWTGKTRSVNLSSIENATDEISSALVPTWEHAGIVVSGG